MKEIKSWNIICIDNPYRAPELTCYYIMGTYKGKIIRTSYIVEIQNDIIITYSGSQYKLVGKPEILPISDKMRFADLDEVSESILAKLSMEKL